MKKLTRISLLSLAFSLCIGSSVMSFKNTASPTKLDAAVNNVIICTANDATCSDTKYYSQSGSDLSSMSYTSTLNANNTKHYNFNSSEGTYSATEDSSNMLQNAVFRPFFIYPQEVGQTGIPAATQYILSITFTLTLNKAASGGGAYAFAELFFLGNGNGKPTPSLANGTFDTNQSRAGASAVSYSNAANVNNSIGVYSRVASDPISTSKTLSISFVNESTTQSNVVRYQLGLFVCCNYAESYNHQTSGTVTATINSVTKQNLEVSTTKDAVTNYYTDIDDVLVNKIKADGYTLNLLRNAALDSASNLNYSMTIRLNGFTLTLPTADSRLLVNNNKFITIDGGGGTILKDPNSDSPSDKGIISAYDLVLNNVTIRKTKGGSTAAVIVSHGFSSNSSVTIECDSTYVNSPALHLTNGANATLNGTTVISNKSPAIAMNGSNTTLNMTGGTLTSSVSNTFNSNFVIDTTYNSDTYPKTLNLSGSITANGAIRLKAVTGSVINASGLTSNLKVSVGGYFAVGTTFVTNDSSSHISVVTSAASGYRYLRSGGSLSYEYQVYTVSFNSNGGTGSMSPVEVEYNNSILVPACTMTAPAGKKFSRWDTSPDGMGTPRYVNESYKVAMSHTLYAIWVDTAQTKIANQASRTDLYYQYHWYDNGTFSYSNVAMRFGALMSKALWDELATETTIQGYGVLVSQENYIGGDPIKDVYADDPTDPRLENFYMPKAQKATPSLATDTQRGDLVGQYYIWNVFYKISSLDLTKTYVAAAYIKTTAGIVYLNEIRTSAAKNAYDMIQAGADVGTSNGSLKNLADMYDPD